MLKQEDILKKWKIFQGMKRFTFASTILPPPYKGVRGKGSVEVHRDVNFNILIAQKIHLRYLGNLEHPIAHELEDAIKEGQSVVLEISPKYYSTWDYSKQ